MEINATNIFSFKPHKYSQIFPTDTTGESFSGLVTSIKKLGRIRNAVIVYQNQILDGNRRLRACKIAKVVPRWIEFKGTEAEALEMVWDLNYNRRDLNPSQRAFALSEYFRFLDQGQHPSESVPGNTLDAAAEKAGVSKSTIRRAREVVQHGTKQQIESVRTGESTVKRVASDIRAQSSNGKSDVDALGLSVPEQAKVYWNRRGEAQAILTAITRLKSMVSALRTDDPMWREVSINGVLGDLSNAFNRFKAAVPAYVCPYCQGANPARCTACKGRGVVSKHLWDVAVPVEMKRMREKAAKK